MKQKNGLFLTIIFVLVGLALMVIEGRNIYKSQSYEKQEATIIECVETTDSDGNTTYAPKVKYTVNEIDYEKKLNESSAFCKVGKTKTIYYDPNNPSEMLTQSTMYIIFAVGLVFVLAGIFSSKSSRKLDKMITNSVTLNRAKNINDISDPN